VKKGEILATRIAIQAVLDDVRDVLMETEMKRLSKAERDRLKDLIRVMVQK
jgi:hypothetical protein